MSRDLLTLLWLGGPVLWSLLAYLTVFFGVGLYGLVSYVLSSLQGGM